MKLKDIKKLIKLYFDLCKFNVVLLMLLSAAVGMIINENFARTWGMALFSLLGIGVLACAGGAINQLLDQEIDLKMSRTKNRPLPKGTVSKKNAIILIVILILIGVTTLSYSSNDLTLYLTIFAMFGYSFIYTLGLKHLTSQNIVIGGITGAMPPLLGWCAVAGSISYQPLILVMIIYTWTPAHFWALAIAKYNDYAKLEIPMLPLTHGVNFTKRSIMLYTIITASIAYLPYTLNMTGIIYLICISILNLKYLALGLKLYFEENNKSAMPNFLFSISYLALLFSAILIDNLFYQSI